MIDPQIVEAGDGGEAFLQRPAGSQTANIIQALIKPILQPQQTTIEGSNTNKEKTL